MALQTGVGTTLVYKAEASFGVKPVATTPFAKTVRRVSGMPTVTAAQITSNELRPDRMISSMRQGQRSNTFDLAGELAISSWDDWLEMAMGGTWTGDTLKIGKNHRSMTIEAKYTDIAKFQTFYGMRIGRLALSIQPNAIATCTFSITGIDGDPISGTEYFTTIVEAGSNQALTGTGGVLTVGGSTIAIATAMDVTLDNTLNAPAVIGSKHAPDILLGRAMVSGTLTALFQDEVLVNAFLNETNTAISMTMTDVDSTPDSTMNILLSRARFSGATIAAQGDTGALVTMPFTGLLDSASSTSLQLTRVVGTYP